PRPPPPRPPGPPASAGGGPHWPPRPSAGRRPPGPGGPPRAGGSTGGRLGPGRGPPPRPGGPARRPAPVPSALPLPRARRRAHPAPGPEPVQGPPEGGRRLVEAVGLLARHHRADHDGVHFGNPEVESQILGIHRPLGRDQELPSRRLAHRRKTARSSPRASWPYPSLG